MRPRQRLNYWAFPSGKQGLLDKQGVLAALILTGAVQTFLGNPAGSPDQRQQCLVGRWGINFQP